MILQKTYHLDYISKKHMINRGALPKYYVENSHEAIIDKDTFERVQQELARRSKAFPSKPNLKAEYPLSKLIRCGICGRQFDRKITAVGTKYAKPVWMCWTFDNLGKSLCPSQRIPEAILFAKTSEVLGCTNWDREMLLRHIAEIRVPEHNHLTYVFQDGHTQDVFWQNPSRRESWTEEMKQAARERTLKNAERRRKHGGTN